MSLKFRGSAVQELEVLRCRKMPPACLMCMKGVLGSRPFTPQRLAVALDPYRCPGSPLRSARDDRVHPIDQP